MIKITSFLKKKWYIFIIIAVAIVSQCYLQLMLPEYMSKIQTLITSNYTGSNLTGDILVEGGWMVLIAFGVFALAIIQFYFASYISAYTGKELRKKVFTKINSLSLADYNKFGTATLITRTTNDIEQIKNYYLMAIRILIMSPTMMIIAFAKTLSKNAQLSIIIGCCIPIILLLMILIFIFASPLFKTMQVKIDNLTVVLRENLTGIRVIRAYNQESTQYKKFNDANIDLTKTTKKVNRIMSVANPSVTIIFNLCYVGIYALGFYLAQNYKVFDANFASLIGDTAEVAQYSSQIMMSFMMFAMVFIMLPQASACSRRVSEILNLPDTVEEDNTNFDESRLLDPKYLGTVEFKDVSFAYPDSSEPCITNISFKTKPGETTAIIGSTGSGKSTIINLIPKFYLPTSGEILIDGVNIKEIPQHIVRDRIGFVPQQAVLFYGSIKDNIKFGKPDATDEEINEVLKVAQTEHFISKLPDGLNTFVSQSGKNFSGGQKQRLAIARALIKKPEIYVFDDSFSALDFKTDVKLRSALKQYTSSSSMIIVAQRVSSIIDADNIIVINDGKVVGQGKHNELLANCSIYQDIVKSQLDPEEVEKTIQLSKKALKEDK